MEYSRIAPDTFKTCGTTLLAIFSRGRGEKTERAPIVQAHDALLSIIHDLSSRRPSSNITRLTGVARRALQDLHPERDFSIREAIIAELAFICETLARVKFGSEIEEVSKQGARRMSEARLFCDLFRYELAKRRPRVEKKKSRRRRRRA